MADLVIQSVGDGVVGWHGGEKMSTHRPETLDGRYEIARDFVGRFGLDLPITIEAIDAWAMENKLYEEPELCIGNTASSRRWLVDQRQKLKKELNYGGKSATFDIREQFQLQVLKQGRTWIAKSNLLTQAVVKPAEIGKAVKRDSDRGLKEAQRLIASLAASGGQSERQKEVAEDILNSLQLLDKIVGLVANDAKARTKVLELRTAPTAIEHKPTPSTEDGASDQDGAPTSGKLDTASLL